MVVPRGAVGLVVMGHRYPSGAGPKRAGLIAGFRRCPDRATLRCMKRLLFWITVGAAIAWFADPVSGEERRRAINSLISRSTGGSSSTGSTL
jgi:hypothetical protein